MSLDQKSSDTLVSFVDGIVDALFTGGELAAETYITAQAPIFANPVMQEVLDSMIGAIGSAIERNMINSINAVVFNMQAHGENSKVKKAATILNAAKSSGNKHAITKSTESLIAAYRDLISSDSPSPS